MQQDGVTLDERESLALGLDDRLTEDRGLGFEAGLAGRETVVVQDVGDDVGVLGRRQRTRLAQRHVVTYVLQHVADGLAVPVVVEERTRERRPAHLAGHQRITVADGAVHIVYAVSRVYLVGVVVAEFRPGGIGRRFTLGLTALGEDHLAGQKQRHG